MATIDPSIALGVKPVQIEDPINRFARQQELSVNALKMQEMEQSSQRRNKLLQLDPRDPDYGAKALQIDPETGSKILQGQKTQGDINKQRLEETREAYKSLDFNTSDQNFQAFLQDAVLKGRMTPQQAEQEFATIAPLNPDQRRAYVKNRALTAEKLYGDQSTRRGQDIQRIPVGYRQNAAGELEAIPGGPTTTNLSPKEMQQREAKYPQATLAVKSFEAKTGELEKDLITLRNHPGLASITGIVAGRAPGLTKDGRAAQALYDKILSRGGFKELQDMRAASPSGGALGNVSNQEGTQLRQSFAAIDRVQDAADVQKAIDSAITDLQGSKSRVREAYDMTYDYKAPAPSGKAAPGAPAGEANNDPLGLRKR